MATSQLPSIAVHNLSSQPLELDGELVTTTPPSLALQRTPEVVLEEAARAAQALRRVIETKQNKCVINGKTYLQFEDWQTLGRFYGITSAARATSYIERGRVRGYECHAEAILVSTGAVIGAGQAECLDDEAKWHDKPLFQLRSMSQTRAQAKALRGVLAWVVVLAGYAPTPAEEMDGNGRAPAIAAPVGSAGSLPGNTVTDWCNKIATAANFDQVTQIFRAAYSQASASKDQRAQAAYIAAKDRRRGELRRVR